MMKKRNVKGRIENSVKHATSSVKRSVSSYSNNRVKRNKGARTVLNIVLTVILIIIGLTVLFCAFIVIKAPKFDPNNLKYKQMSIVYDSKGNVIAKLGDENRTEISYDDIPEVMINAIVATEDSRFYEHNGFDLPRFLKATLGHLIGKSSGGASTITMQIVKNNYTSTVSSGVKGIIRKFTDIYLSIFKVERKYTKKQILEFYVNDTYLGNGAYGIEQASKNYFGKSVSELNLAEASFIAGLFQSPVRYNPYNYPENAEARRQTVLYLMEKHGYITDEERKIAESQKIKDLVQTTQASSSYSEYQGYIDTVIEELDSNYNLNPYTTPLLIYTSMNKDKQDFVNKVMNGEAWTWENDAAQAGVVMTNSSTGEVLAVGAGRNKNTQRSFNFATMTNRQIGSTSKPIFDYGPAVEYLGWGTVNYIIDEPWTYTGGTSMSNYDGGYYGTLPMYKALGLSRNIPALKTFQQVSKEAGNDKIIEFAESLGLSPEVESGKIHEAHSIGAFTGSSTSGGNKNSPMTMAGAYSAFSNGGYYIKPHTITKYVYKETSKTVVPSFSKKRVMKDSTAYIINYALNWAATSGEEIFNVSGANLAVKTGTTNFDDATIRKYGLSSNALNDLWVCGYTPKEVITMWYGYQEISSAHYNTTSSWSTRDNFYRNLAKNMFDADGSNFEMPSSVEAVQVVRNSIPLKLASASTPLSMQETGYFAKGTAPTETTTSYDTLPSITGLSNKVSGNKVTLSWTALTADQMVNLASDDSFGDLGYDVYVKDGTSGGETYLGTTTGDSYTTTTSLSNPVFIIYTAYANYKANRSNGVSTKASVKSDFDINVSSINAKVGDTISFSNPPVTVLYNSVDVTSESKIEVDSSLVDTSKAGEYTVTYTITYSGNSKKVTGKVIIKDVTTP